LLNEKATHKRLIDNRLQNAGWDISNTLHVVDEYNFYVGLPEGIEEPLHEYNKSRNCERVRT